MNLDKLLDLAWVIAEAEARALGSAVIAPMHFLLAALKIVDVNFTAQLDKLDISSKVWKGMCKDAKKVQGCLDVLPEKITTVRRRIRHRLARTAKRRCLTWVFLTCRTCDGERQQRLSARMGNEAEGRIWYNVPVKRERRLKWNRSAAEKQRNLETCWFRRRMVLSALTKS